MKGRGAGLIVNLIVGISFLKLPVHGSLGARVFSVRQISEHLFSGHLLKNTRLTRIFSLKNQRSPLTPVPENDSRNVMTVGKLPMKPNKSAAERRAGHA